MNDAALFGAAFWAFLILYGAGMYVLSPRAVGHAGFFQGHDAAGRPASAWALGASIFISWIFAKSITNAANLGASFGIVGGLAYATYWLSIPLAGWAILRLRTRHGATGLVSFLVTRHGRLAALAFSLAILVRLFNEVWSNTSVVGGYYGEAGSAGFIGAALLFTAATLFYSIKGGLRSSIYTDVLQTGLFVAFFAVVMFMVLPAHGPLTLLSTGDWRLDAGVDLLLVAALQVLSYPFHDPVLTDRGFITEERRMLRAFIWAGALGFVCILLFSLVGVHAHVERIAGGDNVPAALARALGPGALFVMTIVMVAAAGSTLDSTFSSLARHVAQDLPALAGRPEPTRAIGIGMTAMAVIALVGNIPMLTGTDILKATTVSGTMVIGLAPVFLLAGFTRPGTRAAAWSFHIAFWTGMTLGVLLAAGLIPDSWAIGDGKYAKLLGTNLYGLVLCTAGYLLPSSIARGHRP